MEEVNQTYTSGCPSQELTLADMAEAFKKIKPFSKRIVMCKKHWQSLKKQLPESDMSPLLGIPVEIKPYLKKVRIYTTK